MAESKVTGTDERLDRCTRILKSKAGLTRTEAEAYLSYWVPPKERADMLGISMEELEEVLASARKKIEATGKTDEELFGKHKANRGRFVDY